MSRSAHFCQLFYGGYPLDAGTSKDSSHRDTAAVPDIRYNSAGCQEAFFVFS